MSSILSKPRTERDSYTDLAAFDRRPRKVVYTIWEPFKTDPVEPVQYRASYVAYCKKVFSLHELHILLLWNSDGYYSYKVSKECNSIYLWSDFDDDNWEDGT